MVRHIAQANKAIRKTKPRKSPSINPSSFTLDDLRIVAYKDASFGNLPDGGSQGAYVIFLCDPSGWSGVPHLLAESANSTDSEEHPCC